MKKLSVGLLTVLLWSFFSFTSCTQSNEGEKARDQMEEGYDDMNSDLEMEKQALRDEIQQALKTIDQQVEKLNQDLKSASAEAKTELEKELEDLKAAKEKLTRNLDSFGDKTAMEWDQFKDNVRKTIQDIGKDNEVQEK